MSHDTRRSFLASLLSSIAGALAAGSLLLPRRADAADACDDACADELGAKKYGGPPMKPKYGVPTTKYGGPPKPPPGPAKKYGGPTTKVGGPSARKYGGPKKP
jgi:hypothetical protein